MRAGFARLQGIWIAGRQSGKFQPLPLILRRLVQGLLPNGRFTAYIDL
jgi:hypothetical protein